MTSSDATAAAAAALGTLAIHLANNHRYKTTILNRDDGLVLTVQAENGVTRTVLAQQREDDEGRLWFCWPGSVPLAPADDFPSAVTGIKTALRRMPTDST